MLEEGLRIPQLALDRADCLRLAHGWLMHSHPGLLLLWWQPPIVQRLRQGESKPQVVAVLARVCSCHAWGTLFWRPKPAVNGSSTPLQQLLPWSGGHQTISSPWKQPAQLHVLAPSQLFETNAAGMLRPACISHASALQP